jgi:peptidoglycan/LPS O-acetylase OafA/YrhL
MATSPRTTIDSLQAGRGLAAMAVVCHHADLYVTQQVGPLPHLLSKILSFGWLGVDFFFVLSGFIIWHTNEWRVKRPGWPRDYVESRLTRIFLPYWPVGIAIGLAYVLLPGISRGDRDWNWFSTLSLLPSGAEPALSVAWTLQHEVLFYGIAFLLLWTGRVLLGATLWAAAILLMLPLGFVQEPGVAPIDLEFLFGIACAWCLRDGKANNHALLLAAGLALLAAFFLLTPADRLWSVVFGLGLALILLPIVRSEVAGRLRIAAPLILFGNASYAIYLVHVPLMSVLVRVGRGLDPLLLAAVAILISAVVGIAYHKLFELPLLNAVRRWLRPGGRQAAAPAGAAPVKDAAE